MMLAESQTKQHQMIGRMAKDKLIWIRNEAVEVWCKLLCRCLSGRTEEWFVAGTMEL